MKQDENNKDMTQFQALMHWKLGLGDMGKFFEGRNHMPRKDVIATELSWEIKPMPDKDISKIPTSIPVSDTNMEILKKGHIPAAMEDHWFMYCDDENIRYYRSWTGDCAYIGHFRREDDHWLIDELTINHALMEFGVNGDEPALFEFIYLITAELGIDASRQWHDFIGKWEERFLKDNPELIDEINTIDSEPKESRIIPEEPQMVAPASIDIKGHICEGCYYADSINNSTGCGRLWNEKFRESYESGKCDYRKTTEEHLLELEEVRKRREEEERMRQYRKEQRLLRLDKQDGTYERKLIQEFIDEKLGGDINKLVEFDFTTLKDDKKYGDCKGFAFSVDKCNIVQAIMSVTFDDLWPRLTMDSIEHYTYTVSRVNLPQYLFGSNILDEYFKGLQKFNPTKEQHRRCLKVYHMLERIGNMWVLPKGIAVDKDTYHYHGYADLYLQDLYKVMTGKAPRVIALKGMVYDARHQMGHLEGAEGFTRLAEGLYLDDYLDYYRKPTDVLPHVWSMMNDLKAETYFQAVDEYCTFMERFVAKRGKLITEKLRKELLSENHKERQYIEDIFEEEANNEYAKVGHDYIKELDKLVEDPNPNKGRLFKTLKSIKLCGGCELRLELASRKPFCNTSAFYVVPFDKESNPIITPGIEEKYVERKHLLPFLRVKKDVMGIWQAFLLYQAGALLPTFWHGGYQRKILIFCHDDLKLVHELKLRYGRDSLHGIKDVLSPKVKMRGNEGTIEYCFWNEWNGLVKETYKVKYEDYTIAQFTLLSNEVIYEYDCGICF